MSFNVIQSKINALEIRLIQADSYESIITTINEIMDVIIECDEIEHTNPSEPIEPLLSLRKAIIHLRAHYRFKIESFFFTPKTSSSPNPATIDSNLCIQESDTFILEIDSDSSDLDLDWDLETTVAPPLKAIQPKRETLTPDSTPNEGLYTTYFLNCNKRKVSSQAALNQPTEKKYAITSSTLCKIG